MGRGWWGGVQLHDNFWYSLIQTHPSYKIASSESIGHSVEFLRKKHLYKDVSCYFHHLTWFLTKSETGNFASGLYCLPTRYGLIIANNCCGDDFSILFPLHQLVNKLQQVKAHSKESDNEWILISSVANYSTLCEPNKKWTSKGRISCLSCYSKQDLCKFSCHYAWCGLEITEWYLF